LRIIIYEKYIQQKLAKFSQILGILNNTFQLTLVQKFSKHKIYNALAVPILLYVNGIWALRKRDKNDWLNFFFRSCDRVS